uniref:Uncharacterized protein n=1 Tax=Desulfobacca acetoxidans TaxID=60893 RepID=A0A7V4G8V1_9BACT
MGLKPGIAAVQKLMDLGYRFNVQGETIKGRYEGPGEPDPARVRPLLAQVGAYKEEVLDYLKGLENHPNSGKEIPPSRDPEGLPPGDCPCGSPAWGVGEEGRARCWACLAAMNMFRRKGRGYGH